MKRFLIATTLLACGACVSVAQATQDVESPHDVLAYLRMLLVVPEISQKVVEYGALGCTWTNQLVWSGSPTKSEMDTGIYSRVLSMQFTNSANDVMWVQFAFSSKDWELMGFENITDQSKVIDCAK